MTIVRDSFYINGEWVPATSGETIEVTSSGTGELYATVPAGTVEEANQAVDAAAAAETGAPPDLFVVDDQLHMVRDAQGHGDRAPDLPLSPSTAARPIGTAMAGNNLNLHDFLLLSAKRHWRCGPQRQKAVGAVALSANRLSAVGHSASG